MSIPHTVSDIYRKVSEILSEGGKLALASVIKTEGSAPRGVGAKMIVIESGSTYGSIGGGCLESYVQKEAKKAIANGQSNIILADLGDDSWSGLGMACGGKVEILIEPVKPDPRLIIFGSGHVAEALAKTAQNIGYKIFVADPYAKQEDFPLAEVFVISRHEGYTPALEKIKPSLEDSIVVATRHRADEEALNAALTSKVGYVGMLGSKNRVKKVYEELQKQGISQEKLSWVHAPTGLDLGAETPEEISISIMAEIIKVRKGGTGASKSLKQKATPLQDAK